VVVTEPLGPVLAHACEGAARDDHWALVIRFEPEARGADL
jgi:hypothetical protein